MPNDKLLKSKRIGGLVLKTRELLQILNEPAIKGIGFGLYEKGKAQNVDLIVYKIFQQNEKLVKEPYPIKFKMGASAIDEPTESLNLFQFNYLDKLESSNFDFTYIKKEKLLEIVENEEEEVFLSGTLLEYKQEGVSSQLFTIAISPREDIDLERIVPPSIFNMLPSPPFNTTISEESKHIIVRTFFATDREATGSSNLSEVFGGGRAEMSYGTCEVSIPRDHRMGQLESPSIWKFEWKENSDKHVVLLKIDVNEKNDFFNELSKRVSNSETKKAFLFVHGYNVTFEDAARRTAQISYDLGFDGAPVFYSWPSQGNVPKYMLDEANIKWSQTNLRLFLEDFFTESKAEKIFVIAHSMGNRSLTRALGNLLKEKPEFADRLEEIILTAPDIDTDVFKRDIAPVLIESNTPITLYASSTDLPLIGSGSKVIHGYPRVGDSRKGIVILDGIESIDATGVDTSFLGHSYFAETRSVLSDIFYIVKSGARAKDRFGLQIVENINGKYWKFKE